MQNRLYYIPDSKVTSAGLFGLMLVVPAENI